MIGRKFAFNTSLFLCSVFAIVAGASPNWYVLGLFVALAAFGAGGNLVLDATVLLEYLPGRYQWLLTLLACWWGFAPVIAAGFAWPLLSLPQYICTEAATCTRSNNMGWRYIWFGNGALVLVMSVLRVTVIQLRETPKFLLSKGEDAKVVETFQYISQKYNRPCNVTLEKLEACGPIKSTYGGTRYGLGETAAHLRGLFQTKKLGLSTGLIWLSWTLIGLAYPLFYVFLPEFLASRGAQTGEDSPYYTWRNYFITNTVGIFGPVLAGFMCNWKYLGRRYTMAIGALITMAFFFAYTAVRTAAQNLGESGNPPGSDYATDFLCSFYLHDLLLHQHVLWLSLRLYSRGASVSPSCHWVRYCDWLQPRHGIDFSLCRYLRQHCDQCSDLPVCGAVHCYGKEVQNRSYRARC